MSKEAMKLALEGAANYIDALGGDSRKYRQALAEQPAQQQSAERGEPVAWRTFDGEGGYDYRTYDMNENYAKEWDKQNPKHKGWVEPLYTSPQAQRTWVGLTDDERLEVAEIDGSDEWFWKVCKAIEAKLREKNT